MNACLSYVLEGHLRYPPTESYLPKQAEVELRTGLELMGEDKKTIKNS